MNGYLGLYGDDLYKFVIYNKDVKSILDTKEFKEYILIPENHYAFVWLIQDLSLDNVNILLDDIFLEKIIETDERALDKFNAIIESKSEAFLLSNDKIIEFIIDNTSLHFLFCNINFDLAEKLFEFINDKRNDKLSCFCMFNEKTQEKLLTLENIEKLNNIPTFLDIFLNLAPKAILKLLSLEKYNNFVGTLNKDKLTRFAEKIKNTDFSKYLLSNNAFIMNIVTLEDPNYYRNIINNLLYNNYEVVEKIEKYRLKYIKHQFNTIGEDGIFQVYKDITNYVEKKGIDSKIYDKIPNDLYMSDSFSLESLLKLTNKRKFELLCDIYFKDYATNVLFNLKEIIKYDKEKNMIPAKRLTIYSMFLNFNKLSQDEINLLIENMDKEDYSSLLYEDIINMKNSAYNSYNDNFIKLDKSSDLFSKELSKEKNVDVYCLEGQDFLACVHCGYFVREGTDNKTISLSLIGTENIGVFNDNNLILGFNYLNPEKIMHVYNSDSYTSRNIGSNRVNKIYDGHDLLKETHFYNEVLYSQKNADNLTADYVVCMNEINDRSLEYAKDKKIPILVINTKKYTINNFAVDSENYQDSYQVEGKGYFAK